MYGSYLLGVFYRVGLRKVVKKTVLYFFILIFPVLSNANDRRFDICEKADEFTRLEDAEFRALQKFAEEEFKAAFSLAPELAKGVDEFSDNWFQQEVYTDLAMCFMRGSETEEKMRMAKSLLVEAERLGSKRAAHMLASMRILKSPDFKEQQLGVKQLQTEFSEGSAYAAGKLGWAYQHGYGVAKNQEKSLELYHYAAKNGMTYWQYLLSHAYEKGYLGLEVDVEKAKYWLNYTPKVHIARYECWVSTYYENGTYPLNDKESKKYREKCYSANR